MLTIFEDALQRGYERILFMEDDVIFDREQDSDQYQTLNKAINYYVKKDVPCLYHMGHHTLKFSYNCPHTSKYNTILNADIWGGHAIVLNRSYVQEFVSKYRKDWAAIDNFKELVPEVRVYVYNQPLAYQLIEETENRKSWGSIVFDKFVKDYELDTTHKNWKKLFRRSYVIRQTMCGKKQYVIISVVIVITLLILILVPVVCFHCDDTN